jgi:hypothetical protein
MADMERPQSCLIHAPGIHIEPSARTSIAGLIIVSRCCWRTLAPTAESRSVLLTAE